MSAQTDEPEKQQIHYRIRKYAEDHPEATVFFLETEGEVCELLLAIAATIHVSLKSMSRGPHKSAMKMTANNCRAAVVKNTAGEYFRTLAASGDFEMFGLTIKTSYTPTSSVSAVKGGR